MYVAYYGLSERILLEMREVAPICSYALDLVSYRAGLRTILLSSVEVRGSYSLVAGTLNMV